MAALTESGARRIHAATTSTTAETWGLTSPVKQVFVTNRDTDPCFVTVLVTDTLVSDDTGIVTAVADADETFVIPAGKTRRVFKSGRRQFVRGSIIGNVSTYDIEGSDYSILAGDD